MHDILIYLLDEDYRNEIQRLFSGEEFHATVVSNLESVSEACQQELFDVALVWGASHDKINNFITLLGINKFNYIPVIALVKDDNERDQLSGIPLVDVMKLPVPRREFFAILDQVIADIDVQSIVSEGMNWQGSVEEYNLVDLIQMIELSSRDAELIMTYAGKSGHLYFRDGKLVDAKFLTLRGIPALYKLAFWPRGNFQTKLATLDASDDRIQQSNQEILILLLEKLHKQGQRYQGLPDLLEDIVKNPLTEADKLTPLQERIANACENPLSIFNLIISLADDNEEILTELKSLMQAGIIGKRSEVEAQVREEQNRSGFSKLLSSISSMFKKKPEQGDTNVFYEEYNGEFISPTIKVMPINLPDDALAKIREKLEGGKS